MYLSGPQSYRLCRVIVFHCLLTSATQGELFIIDENNNIFFLPCGDLCEEAEIPTDDELEYTYIGCYTDNSDRIFSGNFLLEFAEMTTEVSREWVWESNPLFLSHSLSDA